MSKRSRCGSSRVGGRSPIDWIRYWATLSGLFSQRVQGQTIGSIVTPFFGSDVKYASIASNRVSWSFFGSSGTSR